MEPISDILVILGVITFFNFLLFLVCLALFFRAKRAIEFSNKVFNFEAATRAEVEDHIGKLAQKAVEKMAADFGKSFSGVRETYINSVSAAAGDQIKSLGEYVRDLETQIAKDSQLVVSKVMDGAKVEIEGYKQAQMMRIDDEVPKIIEAVSKEVLNKSFDKSAHEELLLSALSRAKAEGIFEEGQAPIRKTQKTRRIRKSEIQKI